MASLYADFQNFNETTLGLNQTIGTRFIHNDSDRPITHLGWLRKSTGSNRTPVNIRLYDQTNGFIVAQPTVVDDGEVGWQWCPLVTPFTPVEGRDYIVATGWNSGSTRANTSLSTPGAPLSPLAWDGTPSGCYSNGGNASFPDTTADSYLPCDVQLESGPLPPGEDGAAPTNANITARLLRFLSSDPDVNTQEGDLPWLTYQFLQTMQGIINEIQEKVDTAEDVLTGILGPTGSLFTGLLQDYLDNLDTLIDQTLDAVDELRGVDNRSLSQIYDAVAAIPTTGGATTLPYDLPGGDYTETDLTTATGSFVWVQPADLYWLHVEDMAESGRTERSVGGESIFWFRGWAKPWDGLLTYPDHIEFSGNDTVIMSDRRWPGVMVWLPPDVEVTIKSYDYTP